MRKAAAFLGLAMLATAVLSRPQPADTKVERLARHLNLGKAFYENPGTQKEAVEEFRQALALNPNTAREHLNYGLALLRVGDAKAGSAELEKARSLDPKLPHPYFNLAVVYKREGDFARALKEFEQVARLAPDEPVTHYNIGAIHRAQGQTERATAEFETAARLDPTLAAPHFQLFNAYRQLNRMPDAQRELARFQEIKKRQSDLGASEDMDWSYYSEILETIEPAPAMPAPLEVVFQEQALGTLGAPGQGVAALDADGDGRVDVLAWSAERLVLYRNGPRGFTAAPVAGAKGGPIAIGDFNNDGLPDLCAGALLYVNRKGTLVAEPKPLRPGSFHRCVWVDYDHDYDLDLLLLGTDQGLMRNNGDGTWTDVSASFPFVPGEALDGAVIELVEDNAYNLVVAYRGRPAVLYRDRKMGRYEAVPLGFELTPPLQAGDFNQDGFGDLASAGTFVENQRGALRAGPKLASPALAFADFQNRGRLDALASGQILLQRGGFAYVAGRMRGSTGPWVAAAAADFNGDGLTDAAVVKPDGAVQLLRNTTPAKSNWVKVGLTGIKNLKLAFNARVEVKAGSHYQKQIYQGVPLVFGLGAYTLADTIRITWPNGLIQNEARQKPGPYTYKEAQRLSGSCPMIFTWNGRSFEFISDVLGVAPLGVFFPLDHDEYVSIPGRALQLRDGAYEVRITEELREVSYLDQIKLIAVDHPAGVEVFTNEKFQGPPFPEFRLFGVHERIPPVRATDDAGRDVLDRVIRTDGRYVDAFARDLQGRAETHSVTVEFPARDYTRPVLFLHGWVDWADGSVFVAASQSKGAGLRAPYLQAKDAAGRWVTVIEDMGMPSGKPKTIAVDLAGKLPSGAHELRIVTNMCVYWDEIFLA